MDLKQYTAELSPARRIETAADLATRALPIWDEFTNQRAPEYVDTVVGMHHQVDPKLLRRSIDAARLGDEEKLDGVLAEFQDPVVALQDLDWELPSAVERIFYAVYNLADGARRPGQTLFGEEKLYVSINQAADALLQSGMIDAAELRRVLFGG